MSIYSETPGAPIPIPGSAWSGDRVNYLRGEKPLHDYLFEHAETVPTASPPCSTAPS